MYNGGRVGLVVASLHLNVSPWGIFVCTYSNSTQTPPSSFHHPCMTAMATAGGGDVRVRDGPERLRLVPTHPEKVRAVCLSPCFPWVFLCTLVVRINEWDRRAPVASPPILIIHPTLQKPSSPHNTKPKNRAQVGGVMYTRLRDRAVDHPALYNPRHTDFY